MGIHGAAEAAGILHRPGDPHKEAFRNQRVGIQEDKDFAGRERGSGISRARDTPLGFGNDARPVRFCDLCGRIVACVVDYNNVEACLFPESMRRGSLDAFQGSPEVPLFIVSGNNKRNCHCVIPPVGRQDSGASEPQ
ncbi:MAG: hypothetical protein JWL77_334 [Chthonomonadaceae bacterium]|nr:hypothetical protein [Chthonomonadaceae bacterium]